jgi:two-component system sensor histidine kinase CssS
VKKTTIKGRIFVYNIGVLLFFVVLTAIVFNASIRIYIEKDLSRQMVKIAERAEMTALKTGPDFFPRRGADGMLPPELKGFIHEGIAPVNPLLGGIKPSNELGAKSAVPLAPNELFRFYFMLDRSLREPLSVLNANYVLLDKDCNKITAPEGDYFKVAPDLLKAVTDAIAKDPQGKGDVDLRSKLSSGDYMLIIRPVFAKNSFGLSWLVVYSSLGKINQLQLVINGILFGILCIAGVLSALFSSFASRKIAAPFSALNTHLNHIADRNFGETLSLKVDDELTDFVDSINRISVKLAEYDKAQKTFLQNASHEFRTPLMSIQGHAEGIQYDVMEPHSASKIIIEESKRMTRLVEDLLYLSRLEAIEENYQFSKIDVANMLRTAVDRMAIIAEKNEVSIKLEIEEDCGTLLGDEEKLIRAVGNLISNGCRHANNQVIITASHHRSDNFKLQISISDDGAGFKDSEMPHLFDRFYKGHGGNFGLGMSIAKAVIERHGGQIRAANSLSGACVMIEL